MDEEYSRLKAALDRGEPVPEEVGEWLLEQLSESKAVFAERDRLIGFHTYRLGNGKRYRGCERLLEYLAAEHPSVQDLAGLNCPIPQIRQLYNIAVANPPPKKVRRQKNSAGDNLREWQDERSGRTPAARIIDGVWRSFPELDAEDLENIG